MEVTVLDRELEKKLWGNGYFTIRQIIKTVIIGSACPVCGKPRGLPRWERRFEDGEHYDISRWDNPCGHVDHYEDVLREAEALANMVPAGFPVHWKSAPTKGRIYNPRPRRRGAGRVTGTLQRRLPARRAGSHGRQIRSFGGQR